MTSMFICIVPGDLQADMPDLPHVGAPIGNSEAGLFSQSTMVAPTEAHVLARHFSSRHATSITMPRALPSSADADGPTALTETRTHARQPGATELHAPCSPPSEPSGKRSQPGRLRRVYPPLPPRLSE